uniref:Dystroglycan n=1 Tax=Loa loa TaxID=7209 RepID=A0A1I7V9G5_LOALO
MEYFKPIILAVLVYITNTVAQIPEIVELVVGQPFHYAFQIDSNVLEVQDASGEELPTWLIWKRSERILEGVPQPTDTGKTFLRIANGQTDDVMEISVKEEIINPCGAERNTLWMEIAFDTSLSNLSIADQLHLVNIVSKFFSVNSSSLRLYSNKYKEELRRSEVVESGMQHKPNNDSMTIMWKVSCEEIDEDAIDVLEKMLTFDESDALAISQQKLFGWELRKGTLLPRKQRNLIAGTGIMSQFSGFATNEPYVNFEVTTSKTTTRSSRSTKKDDRPPVRLHSLQAFTCRRGMMCEYTIPRETFIDAEDGDTRTLTLSVYPIVADNNWLTLDRKNKQILHGIALNTGDFEFRLEARDSANQAS